MQKKYVVIIFLGLSLGISACSQMQHKLSAKFPKKRTISSPLSPNSPSPKEVCNASNYLEYIFNSKKTTKLIEENREKFGDDYIYGCDLVKADLKGVNLSKSDLRGAALHSANLTDANLKGADLRGAHLIGTIVKDAKFNGADLSDATIDTDLADVNFSGATLIKTHFSGGRRSGSNLQDTNFTGATLDGAKLNWLYIYSSSFVDASLKGAFLIGTKLGNSDFKGADLSDAIINNERGLPQFEADDIICDKNTNFPGLIDSYFKYKHSINCTE